MSTHRAPDALVRHLLRSHVLGPIGVGLRRASPFSMPVIPAASLPWRESYGDVVDGAAPLIYLWSAS